MKGRIKRLVNWLRGRKPRTWEFDERDIPKILQLYDKYQRTGSKEALYRLWEEVHARIPECKGIEAGIKLHAGAIPYVEEYLG